MPLKPWTWTETRRVGPFYSQASGNLNEAKGHNKHHGPLFASPEIYRPIPETRLRNQCLSVPSSCSLRLALHLELGKRLSKRQRHSLSGTPHDFRECGRQLRSRNIPPWQNLRPGSPGSGRVRPHCFLLYSRRGLVPQPYTEKQVRESLVCSFIHSVIHLVNTEWTFTRH